DAVIDVELGAAKHVVVNHSIKIIDIAMRIVGAKSLQMERPLQRYYRDIRAGLHNPPMDDVTITKLAKKAREERSKLK
ncbi:acyl-CoA dehydrogenase, partial [Staphylococcus sp. EG-SA-21]